MAIRQLGLADIVGGDLPDRWKGGQERISHFLKSVGLTGNEHSQSLYIFPKTVFDPAQYLNDLRAQVGDEEPWIFLTGVAGDDKRPSVMAFPVNKTFHLGHSQAVHLMALFIEVHSRLVSWWLVNAWRSQQLTDATWHLGDSMQIIPAAACARSLLETAASFWIETKNLHQIWTETKLNYAENGANLQHWHKLTLQLYKMVWGAKFDSKVPDLEKVYRTFPRMNVLTQIEKLARVAADPVQQDYQWLCNAVHPSVGGMLAFAAPMMAHNTKTCAFQWVCAVPTAVGKVEGGHVLKDANLIAPAIKPDAREATIQTALARSATLAVDVLEKTLDGALKIIDDIGLTTKAPKMANFDYWRNVVQKSGSALCPCRSGRKAKHCLHRWTDPTPPVVDSF